MPIGRCDSTCGFAVPQQPHRVADDLAQEPVPLLDGRRTLRGGCSSLTATVTPDFRLADAWPQLARAI
jgi:hypothetical protein